MPRLLPLACAAALIFAASSPSFAEQRGSEVVEFGDLNLDRAAGADRLIARIENAAERVCDVRPGAVSLTYRDWTRGCAQETTEFAVREVGHPVVLARYYDRNPQIIIEEGSYDPSYDDGYVIIKKPMTK